MNVSTDAGKTLVDFLNGDAICIAVKEGSKDSYNSFSFADSKDDSLDIIRRHFTKSIEVEGSVVASLDRKLADCYLFFPPSYRSTSSQELWEAICTLGNERIKAARRIQIERKLAELDAERAALTSQLEG